MVKKGRIHWRLLPPTHYRDLLGLLERPSVNTPALPECNLGGGGLVSLEAFHRPLRCPGLVNHFYRRTRSLFLQTTEDPLGQRHISVPDPHHRSSARNQKNKFGDLRTEFLDRIERGEGKALSPIEGGHSRPTSWVNSNQDGLRPVIQARQNLSLEDGRVVTQIIQNLRTLSKQRGLIGGRHNQCAIRSLSTRQHASEPEPSFSEHGHGEVVRLRIRCSHADIIQFEIPSSASAVAEG